MVPSTLSRRVLVVHDSDSESVQEVSVTSLTHMRAVLTSSTEKPPKEQPSLLPKSRPLRAISQSCSLSSVLVDLNAYISTGLRSSTPAQSKKTTAKKTPVSRKKVVK